MSQHRAPHRFFRTKSRPIVLGHRGVPAQHQENSLAGFRKALELGIDGVEFDVFLTRDQKVVVFHDSDTERLTGVKGKIHDMTWDEVSKLRLQKRIDMGGGRMVEFPTEERIPLLEEVLAELGGKLLMDIELKPEIPSFALRHTGTETAKVIRQAGVVDSVISTSFDFFKLYSLEETCSDVITGYAYDDDSLLALEPALAWIPEFPSALAAQAGNQNAQSFINSLMESNTLGKLIHSSAVISEFTLIDEDTVAQVHARGMIIGTYTLFPLDLRNVRNPNTDWKAELFRLASLGVDWIETDDPAQAQALLEQRFRT